MKHGMICPEYGKYIRARAKELGLSLLDVAKESGLSRRPAARSEAGLKILTPSPNDLIALAKALDTSVATLLDKLGYRERKNVNGGILCLKKGYEALSNMLRRKKRAKKLNW